MRKDLIPTENRAIRLDDARTKAEKVFDLLDVKETTRADYKARIGLFITHTQTHGINRNSFLEFKRELAGRADLSVATKNKYLTCSRVFLKELNRIGKLPADITQNIKNFTQSKKHKRDGLNDEEITALTDKMRTLPATPTTARLKAILALLTLQGLRQIEVIRLDVRDLDFVAQTALYRARGRTTKSLLTCTQRPPEPCKTT